MRITFDSNCLIDLENHEGASQALTKVIKEHDAGRLTVQVSAIMASEQLPGGLFAPSFKAFCSRLAPLSRRKFVILKPFGQYDITYYDYCLYPDEEMVQLAKEVHHCLFPTQAFRWQKCARQHGVDAGTAPSTDHRVWQRWRNRNCDALAMWCHIYHGGDAFLTRDSDFHKESSRNCLMKLGVHSILHPRQLVKQLAL